MSRRIHVCRLLALLFLAACEGAEEPVSMRATSTPVLTPFATVTLKERDTAYVAKTNSLAVSARGEVFVTDMLSRRILRFDEDGNFLEAIGRRGGGPDEFEGPSQLTALDDSTLAIVDAIRREAVLWDLSRKSVSARFPLPGSTSRLVRADGGIYVAAADFEKGTAGLRWQTAQRSPERLGRMLDVYRDRLPIWDPLALAGSGDSLLFVGGRSEYLIIANSEWQPIDSLPLPRLSRRGVPEKLDLTIGNGRNIYDVKSQLSIPVDVSVLSSNRYAVFHLDANVVGNTSVVGRLFLTVVSPAKSARCIDVRLPTHDSTFIPRMTFLADTLFVLDQFERRDSAVVEVRKYRIGADIC